MRRQLTTTAIIVAVFLVLAAAVYLVEFRRPAPEPTPLYEPLWPALTVDQISRVTVQGALGLTCAIERDGQGIWQLLAPIQATADQDRAGRVVYDLANLLTYRHFAPEEVDLKEFGLITPTATIVMGLEGGEERILRVGAESPKGNTYYVLWGDQVHLCPRGPIGEILEVLTKPPLPPTASPSAPPAPTIPPTP